MCRGVPYYVLSESSKGEKRMDRNSRGSYNADFNQFSKFLRNPRRATPEASPCNSNNGGNSQPNIPQQSGGTSLAMVYPISQKWQGIYDPEIALMNGTIFEELNKPFYPTGCNTNNGCRGNNRTGGTRR